MIPFVKAHACGNDFLIIDGHAVHESERRDVALRLCARNTGVGADGVEFFTWIGERAGRIRLFNADGSVAEISGNGTRCVVAWMAREKRASPGDIFLIETDAGIRECRVDEAGGSRFAITTGMGVPQVSTAAVTLASGFSVAGAVASMGNPHFVVSGLDESFSVNGSAWESIGHDICVHPDFPMQTNVEFVRMVSAGEIEIRIFERGVGPTTSSGTGTCAAAAISIAVHGLDAELVVRAPGGAQRVTWAGPGAPMMLTGPAELIATGEAFE